MPALGGSSWNFVTTVELIKSLPDGQKKFNDMCVRVDTIAQCYGQIDGLTDIQKWHTISH